MTEDHDSDAVRVFWEDFDSVWRDGGALPAEEVSARLQRERNYSLPLSTVRDWLDHKRLPRKDDHFIEMCLLLVGKDRADQLMSRLQAARRAARSPRPAPPSDSSPSTTGLTNLAVIWRQLYRSLRPWHAAVALVVVGVLIVLVLRPEDEDKAPSGTPTLPVQPPSTATRTTAADDSPCPTPTVRAESKNSSRAHATFCADRFEFLLYDDSSDGKSAILVVRVNGEEWPAWFNSSGHADRSPDGSQMIINPPKVIIVSFSTNDAADFRVCAGDRNPEGTYLRRLDPNLAATLTPHKRQRQPLPKPQANVRSQSPAAILTAERCSTHVAQPQKVIHLVT